MAKTVFRPFEIKAKDDSKVVLPLLHDYTPVVEVKEEPEQLYKGPTADDLRREAEHFKAGWEIEKQRMIDEAQKQADEIINQAKEAAFQEVKRQTDEAQVIKADAERERDAIIEKAKAEAAKIISEAHEEEQKLKSEAGDTGYKEGHEQGWNQGQEEVQRLIDRMHKVVEAVMVRRQEILQETEQQIVDLVILMTRKVVKIISETQKTTIMSNVLAALKKVRSRGNVILHVNIQDLNIATSNAEEFVKRVESVQGITVIEDSTVDKGGCIVETDFGEIDARISSQLSELEEKIMEITPVKTVKKNPAPITE